MKMGTEKEVKRLREQFLAIDTDKTGSITFAELKSAFAQIELDPEDKHVQQIIDKSDFDGDQTINYTEFLSATVDLSKYLNE
jgi:calcium-dependent protein kinase